MICLSSLLLRSSGCHYDVSLIDPTLLNLNFNYSPHTSRKNLESLRREISLATKIMLMPLWYEEHWSLMIYLPSLNQWLHCDSLTGRHRRYVTHLQKHLHQLNLCDMTNIQCLSYESLSQENNPYECGQLVLFYIFVILKNAHLSMKEFLIRIQIELSILCESNREIFLSHLENILLAS
jgi:hypothetical protein